MRIRQRLVLASLAVLTLTGAADDRFGVDDLTRLADVAEPAFAPDGEYLAYAVTTSNLETDEPQTDLWRVRFGDGHAEALTRTLDASESLPAWSPDGQSIAFLSDRGGEDATTQVWILPAFGGEARKLTDFAGGVEDYAWSPDGKYLARVSYPFLHADRIRTPTLFYCAGADFNVPCLGGEQMYQACARRTSRRSS